MFIELNDWQLGDPRDDEAALNSAGALSSGTELLFGAPAWQASRLQPQQFNNRYISNLNAEPISGDLGVAKNHADLVYHHLKSLDLSSDQPLTVCVAGHVSNQQLGLLLGIFEALELNVAGFIDSALMHALHLPMNGSPTHILDVELHRLSVTPIIQDADTRYCDTSRILEGCGMMNIVDSWMNVIADEFVSKTRFDPLHTADSEQQLFDQVCTWFNNGGELTTKSLHISLADARRDIEISDTRLQQKLSERLQAVTLQKDSRLALTPRAQKVPGLGAFLSSAVGELVELDRSQVPDALDILQAELEPTQVKRVRQLRTSALPANSATHGAKNPAENTSTSPVTEDNTSLPIATHLLRNNIATPMSATEFEGYIANDGRTASNDVAVNNQRELHQLIAPGDHIEIGGLRFVAIRVD